MDKSPDAFRTISEVAIDLDLPQHVLRFWETRFVQIKPLKRGGGRRYYRPDDVELLKGIRHLLYGEGYTIRGVQRILKEQGVRFVMNVWQDGAPQPPPSGARWEEPAAPEEPTWDDETSEDAAQATEETWSTYAPHHGSAPAGEPSDTETGDPRAAPSTPVREEPHFAAPQSDEDADGLSAMAHRFAPRPAAEEAPQPRPAPAPFAISRATPRPDLAPPVSPAEDVVPMAARKTDDDASDLSALPAVRPQRLPAGLRPPEPVEPPRPGIGQFFDRLRPGGGRDAEAAAAARPVQSLSRDEIRRLQSTLFELLECKRLLDQVR